MNLIFIAFADLELTVLSGTGDITDIQDAERLLQNSGQLGSGGVATGVGGATHRPHRCTVAGCGKVFIKHRISREKN